MKYGREILQNSLEKIRMNKLIRRKYLKEHSLVFLLIANSGMPFFTNEPLILLASLFFTAVFINPALIFKNILFNITLIFLLILLIGQWITTGIFDLRTSATLYVRWIYPFIVLLAVRNRFPIIFVNVMYFFTVISLILFIPSIIIPGFEPFLMKIAQAFEQKSSTGLYGYNSNIIIYTIKPSIAFGDFILFKRNSGPFWEPGGFGSYLIVALLFNLLLEKKKGIFSKRNNVFIIAIITTWSTASLAALSVLIFLYGWFILRKTIYRLTLVPMVLFMSFYVYTELPFVQDRINRTITYFENRRSIDTERRDRMVSAIVDLRTFSEYPFFGTGRDSGARYGGAINDFIMMHRNNGLTDILVKYGLPYFIFYFWHIRKSYSNFSFHSIGNYKIYSNIAIVTIALIGFSQTLLQQSVFIALFYFSSFFSEPNLKRI